MAFNIVEDMLAQQWAAPKKEEPKVAPIVAAIMANQKKSSAPVAKTVAPPAPKGQERKEETKSDFKLAPYIVMGTDQYDPVYKSTLEQKPLNELADEMSKLEELIAKSNQRKPSLTQEVGRLIASKDFGKTLESIMGDRSKLKEDQNDLELKGRSAKGNLAQIRGMLTDKGINTRTIEPHPIITQKETVASGNLFNPNVGGGKAPANDTKELAKRLKDVEAAKIASAQFRADVLSQRNIPGVGLDSGGAAPDWALKIGGMFGAKNAEQAIRNRDQLIAIGNYMTKALSGTRATDRDFQRAIRTFSGETFQSEKNLKEGLDKLDQMLAEDEVLIRSGFPEATSQVLEQRREGFRQGKPAPSSTPKYDDPAKEKRYQEWKLKNGK